ncbi:UNVERIFIED_CONTAM: hypothetical protein GTU68_020750, partial [Idotea baltica]|nr:hypothetical protein [Idotea baltica]
PQEKTLVLVLSKKGGGGGQQIIEVPAPPGQKPEVFFVDYAEGDNTMLPGGIKLQDALKYAAEAGGSHGQGGDPGEDQGVDQGVDQGEDQGGPGTPGVPAMPGYY